MTQANPSRAGWYILLVLLLSLGLVGMMRPQLVKSLRAFFQYRNQLDYPRNHNKTLSIRGLSAPVRVHFDNYGIPHIEAQNDLDLVRAVGFIQARDRFFQIDVLRRIAKGRLSELLGKQPFLGTTTVAYDRAMRGWGFERRIQANLKNIDAKEKELLQAFCDGINTARTQFRHPEYRILGVTSEPMQVSDAFAIGMLNAWSISHNWQQELVRFLLALYLGIDKSKAIYPHTPLSRGVSLPGDSRKYPLPPAVAPELEKMFKKPLFQAARRAPSISHQTSHPSGKRALLDALQLAQLAAATTLFAGNSNAWVVDGKHSSSGKPLFANDPHLSHFLPSLMYQQHLRTPTLDVIGATMPGIPYILLGQNRHIAWGMTSSVADVIDLVIEQPDPKYNDRVAYEGGICKLYTEQLKIRARKGKTFETYTFPLRRTCHGPLLNDMYPHLLPPKAPLVALQWEIQKGVNFSMWAQANRAKDVHELYRIFRPLTTPVTTTQAADTKGNIALFWAGTVPKRTLRGTFPYPGWRKQYQWKGQLSPDEIPKGFNPSDGIFANANNLLVDPERHKHVLQIDSAPPYRVQRIQELLRAQTKHTFASFEAIHKDVKVLRAKLVLPHILADINALKLTTAATRQARKALRSWNFEANSKSIGTTVFFATYRNAILAAMRDKLPTEAFQFFLTQRYTTNITDGWFLKRDHIVWDHNHTPKRETRTTIVQKAFLSAVEQLRANLGDQVQRWRWGRLHRLQMRHPFGGAPLIGKFFNLPPREGMGTLETVWKSQFNMGHSRTPFATVAGPVYRMIVDLNDLTKSRWILDTGASGWPGSPHYGDQFSLWYQGKTVPMYFDWNDVLNAATGTWLLQP